MADQVSIRANVDLMILDYLLGLTISGILCVMSKECTNEDVNWLVESVQNFRGMIIVHRIEPPLPWDLDIKLGIFDLVDLFRFWEPPKDRTLTDFTPLSDIAVQFMDFCHSAKENVSWTRWFDLGARFMVHAILEEAPRFPEPIKRLHDWKKDNIDIDAHWEVSRTTFLTQIPPPYGTAGPVSEENLVEMFPLSDLASEFTGFVEDLMEVLDAPLLVQLEQGQLEGFTAEETQRIRDYCMI